MWGGTTAVMSVVKEGKPKREVSKEEEEEIPQLPNCPESAVSTLRFVDQCFSYLGKLKFSAVLPYIQKRSSDFHSDEGTPKQEIESNIKKGLCADILSLALLEESFYNLSYLSQKKRNDDGGITGYLNILSTLKERIFYITKEYSEKLQILEKDRDFLFNYFQGLFRLMTAFCQVRFELSRVIDEYFHRHFSVDASFYISLIKRLAVLRKINLDERCDLTLYPFLVGLFDNAIFQTHIWNLFFSVQHSIAKRMFTEAILQMYSFMQHLVELKKSLKPVQNAQNSQTNRPGLQQVLVQLFSLSSGKLAMYFSQSWDPVSAARMKNLQGGGHASVSMTSAVESYVGKNKGCSVSVVWQCIPGEPFELGSYSFPWGEKNTGMTGLQQWPRIFSHPSHHFAADHWPNVISLLISEKDQFDNKKDVCYFDRSVKATYFCRKAEERVFLVMIFPEKKKEGDTSILKFVNFLTSKMTYQAAFTT